MNVDPGVGHQAMATAWWQSCITNTTFLGQYPRLKMIINFEYVKDEADGGTMDLRDYRLTNDTGINAAFTSDLAQVAGSFQWASSRAVPTPTASSPGGSSSNGSGGSGSGENTGGGLVFQTARVLNTGAPTLFSAATSLVPPIFSIVTISTVLAFVFGFSSAWRSSSQLLL